jgi:hypothetical protein
LNNIFPMNFLVKYFKTFSFEEIAPQGNLVGGEGNSLLPHGRSQLNLFSNFNFFFGHNF